MQVNHIRVLITKVTDIFLTDRQTRQDDFNQLLRKAH